MCRALGAVLLTGLAASMTVAVAAAPGALA